MSFSIHDIVRITEGRLAQDRDVRSIERLLIDSRKLTHAGDGLFFAIRSERNDGHNYIGDAYAAGVRNFVVEKEPSTAIPEANIVVVKNSITALQQVSAAHRKRFDIPVIGITGSNGKTIVKEWLNQLLCDDFNIVRSPKSYNSQLGVPLSVWNMEQVHTLALFEAGISMPGEMDALGKIIAPTIGIFTSIGSAHSENFLSKRQLIGEKLNLFAHCPVVICPEDGDIAALIQPWLSTKTILRTPTAEHATRASTAGSATIELKWNELLLEFQLPFRDKASVENCITCITLLLHLGYEPATIQDRLSRLTALEMRLQLIEGENDCTLVNDAYSNDLHSLEIALDFLGHHARQQSRTVILSDLFQTGLSDDELHKRVARLLAGKGITQFIGIGSSMSKHASYYPEHSLFFSNTEAFLAQLSNDEYVKRAILIKGARDFRFERIVSAFQQQTHDTVLEINLNALAHNLRYFKSKLPASTKLMVMVKAFGYGSGAEEVASLLEFNKADYLAVAYTDEGVELRKAGISLPVMVMNPERSSLPTLIRHKLEPELYSFRTANNFLQALQAADISEPYAIHIKIDTGMHRLGFIPEEMHDLCAWLDANKQVRVASVFTHLAASDNSQFDDFTKQQLRVFNDCCDRIALHVKTPFLRHALNTGGIERFPDAAMDMVRLGIGLYGVSASGDDQQQLQTPGTWKTVISQIKHIKGGESVGYSRAFVAPFDMTIATIPVGYADGLRRTMSNGQGYVLVRGEKAPIVGNVCMDMTMIDVSATHCSEGDEVELFGEHITLLEFARMCGTIPYEVLTSVSQRVKRVYVGE
ncbi:MAG: bifunctional UDP-N-acetylmuramoyl-tripeptide:D-alanyl-D-alanine ligase/alanine racemase [Flavobacteriales bacterium]|jgi:alanine racemase